MAGLHESDRVETAVSKPTRRAGADREVAFAYWAGLGRERRSYAAVAEKFGVSPRSVERYAPDGAWKQRLVAIEAAAARKVDDELGSRRARQLADFQQLIEDSSIEYARQLASGQVRITASEFVGLIKATLLLHGAPAARIELISASSEWAVLRSRILEALADHPEARLALAEALDQGERGEDDLGNDLQIALDPARLLRAAGMQPDPFQEAICRAEKDTLVLVCRQGGKSTAAGCAAAHKALYSRARRS